MSAITLTPILSAGYNPNAAQEGSFLPLDTSTLTDYPSSGYGKFAQLVYVIGGGVESIAGTGSGTSSSTETSTTNSTVTATTASSTALAANTLRLDATITNYGATGCFLSRSGTATAGQGIYLAPNGGSYTIGQNNLYKGIISCITASSTTTLAISQGQ